MFYREVSALRTAFSCLAWVKLWPVEWCFVFRETAHNGVNLIANSQIFTLPVMMQCENELFTLLCTTPVTAWTKPPQWMKINFKDNLSMLLLRLCKAWNSHTCWRGWRLLQLIVIFDVVLCYCIYMTMVWTGNVWSDERDEDTARNVNSSIESYIIQMSLKCMLMMVYICVCSIS